LVKEEVSHPLAKRVIYGDVGWHLSFIMEERIFELVGLFAHCYVYQGYWKALEWPRVGIVRKVNATLAREYVEKINYPWKFPKV
jgi:hypothetical protein